MTADELHTKPRPRRPLKVEHLIASRLSELCSTDLIAGGAGPLDRLALGHCSTHLDQRLLLELPDPLARESVLITDLF